MNITALVICTRPVDSAGVRAELERMAGVEVHAVTPEGRMVVTVERADDGEMTGVLDRLGRTPGVLSTALAYHHDDPIDE